MSGIELKRYDFADAVLARMDLASRDNGRYVLADAAAREIERTARDHHAATVICSLCKEVEAALHKAREPRPPCADCGRLEQELASANETIRQQTARYQQQCKDEERLEDIMETMRQEGAKQFNELHERKNRMAELEACCKQLERDSDELTEAMAALAEAGSPEEEMPGDELLSVSVPERIRRLVKGLEARVRELTSKLSSDSVSERDPVTDLNNALSREQVLRQERDRLAEKVRELIETEAEVAKIREAAVYADTLEAEAEMCDLVRLRGLIGALETAARAVDEAWSDDPNQPQPVYMDCIDTDRLLRLRETLAALLKARQEMT